MASDFARFQQEADNFASVETIHWWGAYANNDIRTDSFTLRFFANVAGNSAVTFVDVSALNLTRTPTNLLVHLGDPIYEYQAMLPKSVDLDGATTYYGERHASGRGLGLGGKRAGYALGSAG